MLNQDESSTGIEDLLATAKAALLRYVHLSILPALAVVVLAVAAGFLLPNQYTADAVLFMQRQRLNVKLIDSPEEEEMRERFDSLMLQILSRENVAAIIDKYDLYPEHAGFTGRQTAIETFRENLEIAPILSPSGETVDHTFRMSFRHEVPEIAHEVLKKVTSLFMQESTVSRVGELQATKEFLEVQLKEARQQLEAIEKKIQPFMEANFGKLPEHLDQSVARLQNAQSQLATNSRLIEANEHRRANLEAELKLLASSVGPAESPDSMRATLEQLRQALQVLQSRYTERHPEVVRTKERIAALAQAMASGKEPSAAPGRVGVPMNDKGFTVYRQLHEVDVETAKLKAENEQLKELVATLEKDIREMPKKEQELLSMRRDYEHVKMSYDQLLSAKQETELQSRLNLSQRGAKFTIVDEPVLPTKPSYRPLPWFIGGGFVAGLALCIVLPFALHFLTHTYKLAKDVTDDLGLPVLETIPAITTGPLALRRRKVLLLSAAGSASVVAVGCFILSRVL